MLDYSSSYWRQQLMLTALTFLFTVCIFLADLQIPLGVAAGVPYAAVLFFAAGLSWRHGIVALATIGSTLTILGYFLSPSGGISWVVVTNRGLALFVIWAVAILLLYRRKAENKIKEANAELEARVIERTEELLEANVKLEGQFTELNATKFSLQEREMHLQGLLDNVPEAIITLNDKGIIESFNRSAEAIFGYSEEDICGRNVNILMPEPFHSRHDSYIETYLRTGTPMIIGMGPREVEAIRKDGTAFPAELALSVMGAGDSRRFVGVLRDISRRKNREKQLEHAQKMEATGRLTGGIAHDFNNLLSVIIGNLELMEDHLGRDPAAKTFLDRALNGALRGADLTQHLLAFSRKQPLAPKATDINQLVSSMTEMMHRTLGEDIDVETVLAGGLWPAMVDSGQLENALLNLSINARDAMPEGGKLTIETSNAHLDQAYADAHDDVAAGQYVLLAVSDTGAGMPPEILENVFEPFFSTKEVGKGSGLGLSMVYGFVKQTSGHVKIYSEVNQGTTVKLYIPKITEAYQRVSTIPSAKTLGTVQPSGNETILVVEDDSDVRAFVTSALKVTGYDVIEAEDGPKALALLKEISHIDLLFTDVVLPSGMSGRQVADEVEKLYPSVKVLFTSGYTKNAIVHHGRLDEGTELLPKPYTRATLAQRVRAVLDAPKS